MLFIGFCAVLAVIAALVVYTEVQARLAERAVPPIGRFVEIDGHVVHYLDLPSALPEGDDAPAVVFIHGASANLRDPLLAFRPRLEGRMRLVFFDRPGHGWSSRKAGDSSPRAQADLLAKLLERIGIRRAILVGHSWGGSVAAAFAVDHPERTAGLLFLAAVSHPWPGGVTWYYEWATTPVIGPLFVRTLVTPVGQILQHGAIRGVFSPDAEPEGYEEKAGVALLFRPAEFMANAEDVAYLKPAVAALQPHYRDIRVPTFVLSGNRDAVVAEEIHSAGLARDIPGAHLVWLDGVGHMPHHAATDTAVTAIEELGNLARGRALASSGPPEASVGP